MANHQPISPIRPEESAATGEEMGLDDNEQETGTVSPQGHETPAKPPVTSPSPKPRVSFNDQAEEIPPAKPPRPLSPMQHSENTLVEAFPSIDSKVVRAVLVASGGKVEPAFNALLSMSDPNFKAEDAVPPPQPPRPTQRPPMTQMESDELYARQLAEQYNSAGQRTQNTYNQREYGRRGPNQQRPIYDDEEREHSFFDDDLPEIGRNIQQGFLETQKKFNGWFSNFKKRLDGEPEEEDLYSSPKSSTRQDTGAWQSRQNFGPSQTDQLRGIQRLAENQRRSTDAQRYDADPREFGEEEFQRLELRDDEAREFFSDSPVAPATKTDNALAPPQPLRTSSRKTANPDLFKPQPQPPQSGPVDEVDAAERNAAGKNASESAKGKKWQSLTSVAPNPEDDNDPFSLGDDDDEKDRAEDIRKEDTERLKQAARGSITSTDTKKSLVEHERKGSSGTINKDAQELLSGKKM